MTDSLPAGNQALERRMLSMRRIFVWFSFGDWMSSAGATIAELLVGGRGRFGCASEIVVTLALGVLTAMMFGGLYSIWLTLRKHRRIIGGSFVVPLGAGLLNPLASLASLWVLGGTYDKFVLLGMPVLLAELSMLFVSLKPREGTKGGN